MLNLESQYIHSFDSPITGISLPDKFTFPFYYTPHPLVELAANQIQKYLKDQNEWNHNFGLEAHEEGLIISKMFGVMVVKTVDNDIRFITAFSGKLAQSNHIKGFVPPIFDMLQEDGFYKLEEAVIVQLTDQIDALESNPEYKKLLSDIDKATSGREEAVSAARKNFNTSRNERRRIRKKAIVELNEDAYTKLHSEHKRISNEQQNAVRKLDYELGRVVSELEEELQYFTDKIKQLKEERKQRSNQLQQKLFDQYNFLNIEGQEKNVLDIFRDTTAMIPPSGAGDCAAPKLLQFAFQNNLTPICLGEFWWGQDSKSEVRKHGYFYPSCRGKCEPILSHMLKGLEVDKNPMLENMAEGKKIEILYEDEDIAVINKPHEFLSVPGKSISDSVYLRMRHRYPDATGPLIVHRLDMSTSGIMLIAKNKESHKLLQKQFIRKKVSKKYVAILDGQLTTTNGEIKLPLRVDLNDRPRQMVCEEHGKMAHTIYEVVERIGRRTKIFFYPVTGRTHQLRVHAAHALGLNTAILGDDLYGKVSQRLFLHATYIKFIHPSTRELVEIDCPDDFGEYEEELS
jgi:tRNA pseudouridine32 synthase/23S rRNA pseudouridine746 synthase